MFCTKCGNKLDDNAKFCNKCGSQLRTAYVPVDEQFKIDFLYTSESKKTLKNLDVVFPAKNQYIVINGEKEYIDCYYVEDKGWSNDNLYRKIATPDFIFWVKPNDYDRLKSVLLYRQQVKIDTKKFRQEQDELNKRPVTYDEITDEIYSCFIAYKSSMCDAVGKWEDFYPLEEKIAKLCEAHGGKYYKSSAKAAKFAIIFSFINRFYTDVADLRSKGYKVTTFEKALEYFGLANQWDCKAMIKQEKEHKEYMSKPHENNRTLEIRISLDDILKKN